MTTFNSTHRAPNALHHYIVGICVAAAIATPLYAHFADYGWIRGGGTVVRTAPPNLDTAVGWSLRFTQSGAVVGAIAAAAFAAAYCFTDTRRRARLAAAVARCLVVELVWVAASMTAVAVIVNGLLMT